ncbi:chymotrypsinogen A-like [Pimephales promelas]|uniref:chymotrypsinogen A-like n=1 Tax=Pimephales promelas TaxID=90988 RepID=UPI001955E671|nr:chymotrypsinogen A-like [Pimephales promelas]
MRKTCVTLLTLLICVQVCAHDPLYPRVKDGDKAPKKAWPWMVSLHDPTCHICGGSLISRQWVLSAAHCFFWDDGTPMDKDSILVYLGKMTQRKKNWKQKMLKVQQVYTHGSYNKGTLINDIALLHLSDPVKFNKYISSVSLVQSGSDFPVNTRSGIIGWGQIGHQVNLPYPGTLQEAEVFVMDSTLCQAELTQWNNQHQITNDKICAGDPTGKDTQHGDSGGPIMSKEHCSKWVQFGITSWGFPSTNGKTLGVYTRVSSFQQWITGTIIKSEDFPQFVDVNIPCPGPGSKNGK